MARAMTLQQVKIATSITRHPLCAAFLVSLLLHFLLFLILDLVEANPLALSPSQSSKASSVAQNKPSRSQVEAKPQEPPLLFVDVNPEQASETPPEKAEYYSSANTIASNPDTSRNEATPKIEGRQVMVPKTFDSTQMTIPKEAPMKESSPTPEIIDESPKPTATENREVGNLAMVRPNRSEIQPSPNEEKKADSPRPKTSRPRTLAEAKMQKGIIQGEKMYQDGGVKRFSLESNLNVKGTPFGEYDAAFIAAVQARWYTLLDDHDVVRGFTGKVIVEFKLQKDGRITDLKVTENQVSDTLAFLCERALEDPAPFAPFPLALRRMLGADYREIKFTFNYY